MTAYYGLKDSSGNIIEKAWTSLPTLQLHIRNINSGQWYECYADATTQIRLPYSTYSSGIGGPAYGNIPKTGDSISFAVSGGTSTFYKVARNISGYSTSLTRSIAVGESVYSFDSTTTYTICQYYKFTVSATTNSVSSKQVGNIAIYNGSTLLVGSISKSSYGDTIINTSVTSESSSISLKFVATACTTKISNWHTQYFYNGITKNSSAVSDSDTTFSTDTATYNFTANTDTTTLVVDYGKKYSLTISHGSGISSSSVSYTRTHSTGSYVTTTRSPISLSGAGTLYVETGRLITYSASCNSGYVFSTSDGFISQTSGVSSINGSNSSTLSGTTMPALLQNTSYNITASTYTISVSISDHPSWGTVYIDSTGTTSKTLVQGQTYSFGFVSARDNYEAPTVASWYINGTQISGNSYTASSLTGNVIVTCTLTPNAYKVTVSAGSNGSASISGRYNKTSGATLANTGYLYADGRDYMKLTVTPDSHYSEVVASRVISNLTEYSAGGSYCYSLSSAATGSASFVFTLSECVVYVTTDDNTRSECSSTGQIVPFSSTGTFVVYCDIKQDYVGIYKVEYFSYNGQTYTAELQSGGRYYKTFNASTVGGQSTATFTAHVVSMANALTVSISGETTRGTAILTIDGVSQGSVPVSGTGDLSITSQVIEDKRIVFAATPSYGGEIDAITYTGVTSPTIEDGTISFNMPSTTVTTNISLKEKDKVTLALCVANITNPNVAVGKVTLTCDQSSAVYEEVTTLSSQSFLIYKNVQYRLTATDDDTTYTFSGWYLNDTTDVTPADHPLYIDIARSDLSSKYTAKYVMRGTGTITTKYGTKSGDTVTECTLPTSSQTFGLVIDTTPDQTNPDKWVIGNSRYINFHVLDDGTSVETETRSGSEVQITYVWTPVRVEVKQDLDPDTDSYTTVWTYDENNPTSRSGRFVMRNSMIIRLVFLKTEATNYGRVQALFMDGNTSEMGEMSVFATGMNSYYSLGGVAEATCLTGKKAVLTAAPKPGWAFGGWYKFVGGAFVPITSADTGITVNGTIMTIGAVSSSGCTYYADFINSDNYVEAWGDGSIAKTFEWRSKVYVGAQFFALRNVRVYADVYPVGLRIMTATSPNGCFSDSAHTLNLVIQNQSPRHIPTMRLEKYFAFRVTGNGRINHIALASSMEELK